MARSCVTAPIVLVHGILGFSEIRVAGVKIGDYFRHIQEALQDDGNTVPKPPQLDPAGSIEQRAQNLNYYLDATLPGQQVHLIAHSMGGLDSRCMISGLHMADRILSLTTIGTPHHGSPVADKGIDYFGTVLDTLHGLGVDLTGFFDLTTAKCAEFNTQFGDISPVKYYSVAGRFEPVLLDILKLPHDIILQADAAPDDGLVPVSSAQHGAFLGIWPCDHFRLINWATNILTPLSELDDASVIDSYRGLIQNLVAAGF